MLCKPSRWCLSLAEYPCRHELLSALCQYFWCIISPGIADRFLLNKNADFSRTMALECRFGSWVRELTISVLWYFVDLCLLFYLLNMFYRVLEWKKLKRVDYNLLIVSTHKFDTSKYIPQKCFINAHVINIWILKVHKLYVYIYVFCSEKIRNS